MSLWAMAFTVCVLGVETPVRWAPDDATSMTLEKAKAAYEADADKCRKAVASWFESTEQAARTRGDKNTIDRHAADRKKFEEKGILPQLIAPAIAQQSAKGRMKMEAAYGVAIREYTKAKQDTATALVEKQLESFRRTACGVTMAEWVRVRVLGKWRRDGDSEVFVFHPDGKLSEYSADKLPHTTGNWIIGADGAGIAKLANGWAFTFTLVDDEIMSAPARNPRGATMGPWGLRKVVK